MFLHILFSFIKKLIKKTTTTLKEALISNCTMDIDKAILLVI